MRDELTFGYAKALYDFAVALSTGPAKRSMIHGIRLLEKLEAEKDSFYSVFALAALDAAYRRLGRSDLADEVSKRVVQLPRDQQGLLDPVWVSVCYQRFGDLKSARTILTELRALLPSDPAFVAALAEVDILSGDLEEALKLSELLRERGELGYQILGRVVAALAAGLRGDSERASNDLSWVGQSLSSTKDAGLGFWDYRDLYPIASKMGAYAKSATLLFDTLTGRMPLPEFISAWNQDNVPQADTAASNPSGVATQR